MDFESERIGIRRVTAGEILIDENTRNLLKSRDPFMMKVENLFQS
jgi:hypothetical protein